MQLILHRHDAGCAADQRVNLIALGFGGHTSVQSDNAFMDVDLYVPFVDCGPEGSLQAAIQLVGIVG